MKSFLILFFVTIFSTLSLGRDCQNGSCRSNSLDFDTFNSSAGSNGTNFNLGPTFNSVGAFNSLGGRVHTRGGFLFVGENPIFIGDQGEILVKDLVTGQLFPANPNTTSQVLSIYQAWARRVESGDCPNNGRFAIAQRALSSDLNHNNFAGGLQGGFSGEFANHSDGLGGTIDGGLAQVTPSVNQTPQNPATSKPPENHAPQGKGPASPQHPRPEEIPKESSETFDKSALKVFSDGKDHFFLMDPKDAEKKIFVGDGKSFSPVRNSGVLPIGENSFHMLIEDANYKGIDREFTFGFEDPRAEFEKSKVKDASDILFNKGKMTVRCGTHLTDFKEIKREKAGEILQEAKLSKTPKSPCDQFNP